MQIWRSEIQAEKRVHLELDKYPLEVFAHEKWHKEGQFKKQPKDACSHLTKLEKKISKNHRHFLWLF